MADFFYSFYKSHGHVTFALLQQQGDGIMHRELKNYKDKTLSRSLDCSLHCEDQFLVYLVYLTERQTCLPNEISTLGCFKKT